MPTGPRARWAGLLAPVIAMLAACGDSPTQTEGGLPAPPALDAIIEPEQALVEDFGDGWMLAEQWYVEAPALLSSGCEPFDRLMSLGDWGGPITVWHRGDQELIHRATDVNWDAPEFLESASALPAVCGQVEVGATTIEVDEVDIELPGAAAYSLSAYPVPARPEDERIGFDGSRTAVVAFIARDNVVSSLVLSTTDGSVPDELRRLVDVMRSSLDAAPVEATGPFPAPEGPPRASGIVDRVTLRLDDGECRNVGTVEAADIVWELADPAPLSWRGRGTVTGSLTMAGTSATFRADDGTTLTLSSGGVSAECIGWDDDTRPAIAEAQEIGRLDCSPSSVVESEQPDAGQLPEDIARAASADVVRVEPGEPLWWWGLDENDQVVVGIALGDAAGASYQVFTCAG